VRAALCSTYGISDLNVERAVGGLWPLAQASEAESSRRRQFAFDVPGGLRCIWYRLRAAAFGVRCFPVAPASASTSVQLLDNADDYQIFQCPDRTFRQLAVFFMSFWNKQIGFEGGGFGDQKALFEKFIKFPMTES
jgi:hypothetical protein